MILLRSGGRGWGAVGGSAAVLEWPDSKYKTQFIVHGSANVAYEMSNHAGGTLYTQTVDARLGMGLDFRWNETWRGTMIWTHQSGHIADNVPDPDLIGPDLGNEMVDFRVIHDIERRWRFGGGLRPFVITNPTIPSFNAEQFIEWYPHGASPNIHEFAPYLAAGLEEYGYKNIDATFHLQAGLVAGDHFSESSHTSLRLTLGYYNGEDPRLKYFQFKHRKDNFVYAGTVFEM